ncbi:MAG: cache domain-containing protein [Rhodothermaceae bacterium]
MRFETLKNWKIKSKIKFLTFLAPITFLLLYFLYIMPVVEKNYVSEKRREIRNVVETAYGVIETFHSKFKKGELTEEEAKTKCKEMLTSLRFEGNNYFWMFNYDGIMVMHPLKPELIGTNCLGNKDSNGKLFFVESQQKAKSKGAGYVSYMWPKPGKTKDVPKESYIKGFASWEWILGSGIYIDDVEEELTAITRDVLIIVIILSVVILLVGFYISKILTDPVEKLTDASSRVAQGDTDIHLVNDNTDEIGKLTRNFNDMVAKIKIQLDYLQALAVPVFIIDKEYEIQYINKVGAKLVGDTQENIVGTKCYDRFKSDDCNTEKCACAQAMKKNDQITEETVARPNGGRYDIQYTAGPVKDQNGNITGAIESIVDVSEIKEMYHYLNRSTGTLLEAMNKFKEGDLSVSVTSEKEGDDIAKMYDGFNQSVNNIRSMILRVRDAVEATASASSQI